MRKQRIDVGLVTVIGIELEWMLRVFAIKPPSAQSGTLSRRQYYIGKVPSEELGRELSIVVTCVGRPGTSPCAVAATSLYAEFRPRVILLVGIAAGIRDKTKIGEVVFSDSVWDYEMAALTGDESTGVNEEPRPRLFHVSFPMGTDLLQYSSKKQGLAARIRNILKDAGAPWNGRGGKATKWDNNEVALVPSIDRAVIASGNKLLRNPKRLSDLRNLQHGQIKVAEMEATGLCDFAHEFGSEWLVIRSISDFGDKTKNDNYHQLAAQRAAAVSRDFLTHGLRLSLSVERSRPAASQPPAAPTILARSLQTKIARLRVRDAQPQTDKLFSTRLSAQVVAWQGQGYRLALSRGMRSRELMTSSYTYARNTRWGTLGGALYVALSRETAVLELLTALASSDGLIAEEQVDQIKNDGRLLTIAIKLNQVLDLCDPVTRRKLGISDSALYGHDYQYTQSIAQTAVTLGFDGLLMPSRMFDASAYLVVFPSLSPGSDVELISEEPVVLGMLSSAMQKLKLKIYKRN